MARTTTRPPDDPKMWRRLVARTHPDAGGDSELFIWAQGLREGLVDGGPSRPKCGRCHTSPGPATEEPDRISFDADLDPIALSRRVVALLQELEHPYGAVLRLLADCAPATHGRPQLQERRGASYRSLAAIAHAVGMSYSERLEWYRVAESVPLSQRHAGHILTRLKGSAA